MTGLAELEVNGFAVMPRVFSKDTIDNLLAEWNTVCADQSNEPSVLGADRMGGVSAGVVVIIFRHS